MASSPSAESDLVGRLVVLAEHLREAGFDASTSEVIDGARALTVLDVADRRAVRDCLRAALVKRPDPDGSFERAFDLVFRPSTAEAHDPRSPSTGSPSGTPTNTTTAGPVVPPGALDDAVLRALLAGDEVNLAELAEQAVAAFSGIDDGDGSERYFLHRTLRAIDLSRMLSAAMQTLRRDGDLTDLDLMVRRNEIVAMLDEFRRRLAAEIALRSADARGDAGPVDIPERVRPEELDLIGLSRADHERVRALLQPLLRRLAARIGQRRRRHSTGRLDVRRTVRRSLQSGGVPLDVITRRRHPHKPEIVVLCDVSGSVAEFAQFTFTIINALHDEVRNVRSFAFVDGVAEVSDIFEGARFEIPVNRLVERRGVVGLDGHSDYGNVFSRFRADHLDDAIGSGTTLIVTGDARGNYRDPGAEHFARIASRARRVYWLNPEPESTWGDDDSLIDEYRRACTAVYEVRTLGQLGDVIAELV